MEGKGRDSSGVLPLGVVAARGRRSNRAHFPRCTNADTPRGAIDEALTTILLLTRLMAKQAPAPGNTPDAEPASYEAALAELEQLVAAMEGGQLPLDRLLAGYRRGAVLLGYCRNQLEAIEQQVQVLEAGQLKPWVNPS